MKYFTLSLSVFFLSFNTVEARLKKTVVDNTFQQLQSMKGSWTIESEGKTLPIEMSYAEGSKGSIVSEQFGQELSVFYKDEADLFMAHYCNVGNQPRLKLNKEDSDHEKIVFDFFDVTNLSSPEASHIQKVIYKVLDSNKVSLELIWKKTKGKIIATESEKYLLTRK